MLGDNANKWEFEVSEILAADSVPSAKELLIELINIISFECDEESYIHHQKSIAAPLLFDLLKSATDNKSDKYKFSRYAILINEVTNDLDACSHSMQMFRALKGLRKEEVTIAGGGEKTAVVDNLIYRVSSSIMMLTSLEKNYSRNDLITLKYETDLVAHCE